MPVFVFIGLSPRTTNQNTEMESLTFGRLRSVPTFVCIVYSTCACTHVLACNVGAEFDCVSLCEMNVGQK